VNGAAQCIDDRVPSSLGKPLKEAVTVIVILLGNCDDFGPAAEKFLAPKSSFWKIWSEVLPASVHGLAASAAPGTSMTAKSNTNTGFNIFIEISFFVEVT